MQHLKLLSALLIDNLTSLVLVTGNKRARTAPFRKFKWIRKILVAKALGGDASRKI